ncbi:MAG: hypothetical protein IJL32_14210 [Oscillospiraceae bacterium]|nr:hypothetical protein [Oscillospiraceae bacterium]
MDESKTEPRRELDPGLLLRYERDPALIQKIAANNQQLRADLAVIKQHCDSINAQLDEMIANMDRRRAERELEDEERKKRREKEDARFQKKSRLVIAIVIAIFVIIDIWIFLLH